MRTKYLNGTSDGEQVKRIRDRADECRARTEMMTMPEAREGYLRLAAAYEVLAMEEEALRRMALSTSARSEGG